MNLARTLNTAALCVAALVSGTVNTAYGRDRAPDAPFDAEPVAAEQSIDLQSSPDGNGGDPAGPAAVEIVDITLPEKLHGQGLAVPAKLVRPKQVKKGQKLPAMLVLHGSGGLTRMPKYKQKGDPGPCAREMEPQFERWAERLAARGYVVLLPSSYEARGFCDMHVDTDRIPKTFDERPEAVLSRLYDVDAASRWLCDRPEVDCDRMGLLGFSHGASMVILALHWQIDHAIERFRERFGGKLDIEIPDLEPGRPEFQVGVAYYPGCGLDTVLPLETDEDAPVYDKYHPTAPLRILHGDADPLVKHCSADAGPGTREIQSAQVAEFLGADDPFRAVVYDGAAHGFDNAGGSGKDEKASDTAADRKARDNALQIALDQLDDNLK